DTLDGGTGINTLNGGSGMDVFFNADVITGQPTTAITATLSGGVLTVTGSAGNDRISVSRVAGLLSVFDNRLPLTPIRVLIHDSATGALVEAVSAGSVTRIVVDGSDGNDRISLLSVGAIDASVTGGAGNDVITGGSGNDTIDGGAGNDTINGFLGNDSLVGGDGNDSLMGSNGNDVINGNDGDDRLFGGFGNDTLDGGARVDFANGGAGKRSGGGEK